MFKEGILIKDFLSRDKNNLDLFRIVAACMVIIGHSYILFPQEGSQDLIKSWTVFTYSGALAVKIFFFISGLVVTNSLLKKNNPLDFIISRTFRIFPGLLFLLLISALVIAPFLSTFTLSQYFDTPYTYNYIKENLILKTNYSLPKVFMTNPYAQVANGSLWSLPYEVGCYLILLGIYLLGLLRKRAIANCLFLLVLIDIFLNPHYLFSFLGANTEFACLPISFASGAFLAVNADKIKVSAAPVVGIILIAYTLWNTMYAELLFYFSSFAVVLYLSSLQFIIKLKPKYDLSYGIYLWGCFIQQCIASLLPMQDLYLKMILSLILSFAFAAASWFLVEKRFIAYGRYIIDRSGKIKKENS